MLLSPPAAAAAAAGPSLRRNYGLMDTALRIALHSTFSSSRFFSPAHQTPPTDFSILRRAGSWALHSAAQAHEAYQTFWQDSHSQSPGSCVGVSLARRRASRGAAEAVA